ncbi:hypothetical protein IU433_14730 [Nocardia puris]|uniref:hypothetical protein n=1 Tax=Nocardia puris TaxID=208602 RepID=UPI001894F451|nr:hypothetical protein [Nocardia puris]MBF6460294.1 hypothetical protein [Nocardia puris]
MTAYAEFFRADQKRAGKGRDGTYALPSGALLTASRRRNGTTQFLLVRDFAGHLWGGLSGMGTERLTDDQYLMYDALCMAGIHATRRRHPRVAFTCGIGNEIISLPCPREHEHEVYRAIGGIELSMWALAVNYVHEYYVRGRCGDVTPYYELPDRFWELAWYHGVTPDGGPRDGEPRGDRLRLFRPRRVSATA